MFLINAALAQGQVNVGVVDDHLVAGVDGPRVGARWLFTPRLAVGGTVMVNPAPERVSALDEILVQIAGSDQYLQPVRADRASLQLGLDAGPMAWTGEGWYLSPRAHLGLEGRLEESSALSLAGPVPAEGVVARLGAYGGFGAELWRGPVGLRVGWTARSVLTRQPTYALDSPPGDWGVAWSSSRSLDLMVSL